VFYRSRMEGRQETWGDQKAEKKRFDGWDKKKKTKSCGSGLEKTSNWGGNNARNNETGTPSEGGVSVEN